MDVLWSWLGTVLGISNEAGPYYAFWSGFGSDIGEVTLIASVVVFYKHHTCHVDRCWRLAKVGHGHEGTEVKLCRKHHPHTAAKLRAEDLVPRDTPRD